jgi:hypothetical protein
MFFILQNLRRVEWYCRVGDVGTCGSGEVVGKGVGELIRCKQCIHMYVTTKILPVETVPGMATGGGGGW